MDIRSRENLEDKRNFSAVSMILFTLLNRVFDPGTEVCIANKKGIFFTTHRNNFKKNRCIDTDPAREMTALVTCRNLLFPEDQGIDGKNLFTLTTKIPAIQLSADILQKKIQVNS